ncbi:MAG: hypothetical protein JNM56_28460 [Planctomycetia bacterium]|nr:hypothetical protein [Planctomycetia bacterium]
MSDLPVPPKANYTVLYIVVGVLVCFLFLCVAPAIIVAFFLVADQVLTQSFDPSMPTFPQTIRVTVGPPPVKTNEPASQATAAAYLKLLLGRQYEPAHALASPEFSERSSPQTLRDHWERNPVLRDRKNLRFRLDPTSTDLADRHNYRVFWTDDDDREAIMDLVLVRDDESPRMWRIRGWAVR